MPLDEVQFKAFCDKCKKEIVDENIITLCPDCHNSGDNQEKETKAEVLYIALDNIEDAMRGFQDCATNGGRELAEKILLIISDSRLVVKRPEVLDNLVAISKDFAKDHADRLEKMTLVMQENNRSRQVIRSIKKKIEKAKGDGRETVLVSGISELLI